MNRKSSRSHTIFQIKIESGAISKKGNLFVIFNPQISCLKKAKLNLVDLAGSEKLHTNREIDAQHF